MSLFNFRCLIEWKDSYKTFVGRCLETGSVAAADNVETVDSMLRELLFDELQFNINRNSFGSLFSSPAPLDLWLRFWKNSQNEIGVTSTFEVLAGSEAISASVVIFQCEARGSVK